MNRVFTLKPSAVFAKLPIKAPNSSTPNSSSKIYRPSDTLTSMPKVTSSSSFPLSGLFGLQKPSGPTSMHIVNQLKTVMSKSPLFFEHEKGEDGKGKAKGRKRRGKDKLKIGQGGTLDPLADGVLGAYSFGQRFDRRIHTKFMDLW